MDRHWFGFAHFIVDGDWLWCADGGADHCGPSGSSWLFFHHCAIALTIIVAEVEWRWQDCLVQFLML